MKKQLSWHLHPVKPSELIKRTHFINPFSLSVKKEINHSFNPSYLNGVLKCLWKREHCPFRNHIKSTVKTHNYRIFIIQIPFGLIELIKNHFPQ